MKKHVALIARKPKMLFTTLAAVLLAAAVAAGCTFTGAGTGLNESTEGTDYEITETQGGRHATEETETENRMPSGEILKKLDELVSNPDLSKEEIREGREKLGMETVTVDTVEDFLDSIGPDKIIELNPGTYRLDKLPDDYKGNEYVRIRDERQGNRFGGREVVIHDVENLWIDGLGDERVNVVTGDQHANVLTFENSSYIFIDNLRLGHWPKKGGCSGGVAVFLNSGGIKLTNTELFGCGINGLELYNTGNVLFTRSVITDCSLSIMFLSNSAGIRFENSFFKENRGTTLVNINGCSDVVFRECSFENNTAVTDIAALFVIDCAYLPYAYFFDPADLVSDVLVTGSRFINNKVAFDQFVRTADRSRDSFKLENNTFEGGGTRPDASGQNGGIPSVNEPPEPKGETRRYSYHDLEIELTNVKSDRTETMNDDGGNEWKYIVITCYPGAELTVINANMSDPAYSADGKAHPQWGILIDPYNTANRIEITDDMQPLGLTTGMRGVYSLESHLYVFRFEIYQE
jgi:hypothetical protein